MENAFYVKTWLNYSYNSRLHRGCNEPLRNDMLFVSLVRLGNNPRAPYTDRQVLLPG